MTATVPADLSRALGERYELRNVLGRGGMATVYMAYDRKHHREVALKVLRPEIATTIGADRFLKEIEIVARMVHPHILPLHDSGEAEGFVYYVTPYIDGGSLRTCMEREGKMLASRAVAIAAPIADALSYAHQIGVLHRDIKPENVLFARTHPIVADFGIAKAVSSATSGAQLTRTGISLGTPGYMSPEQAAGFTDVDSRTDVYSLAILVYEMIVGQIPGRWVTEESTRAGRFLDAAAAHRPALSAAGGIVEGALVRALALRPDQRTSTPADFIEDLRGQSHGGKRKYRPDEIEAIVNRAAEIEATNPTMSGSMTIGGVEAIAREVGIDPAHVRSAAASLSSRALSTREMPTAEPPKYNRWIGGPTRLGFERVIEGEMSESDFPVLVEEIRVTLETVGSVSLLGRSFTWTTNRGPSGGRVIEVAVSVRNGRTRIVIQENLSGLIGGIFGGIGGGVGGGGLGPLLGGVMRGLDLAGEAVLFLIPAWWAVTFGIARTSYHYAVRGRQRKLEKLADRLAALTREVIAETPRLPSGR